MEFVAFVGTDKENWGQIKGIMNRLENEKVILVKNKEVSDFPKDGKSEIISVDTSKPLVELKEEIMSKLRQKLSREFEVSLSIASGTGKEHMALISALLSIPVGIKFVIFTKQGIEYIN